MAPYSLQAPAASRLQAFRASGLQARAATRLEWDFSDDFNRANGPLVAPWDNHGLFVNANRCVPSLFQTTYAEVYASYDGARDFTIEDAQVSVDIDALWTADTHTRWLLRFGDAGDVPTTTWVQVHYDLTLNAWFCYYRIGSAGVVTFGGGAGHPPAGTMVLTVAKRVVSVTFAGNSGGGGAGDEIHDCPSIVRLRYEMDVAAWSFPWFDNLASHMEGY